MATAQADIQNKIRKDKESSKEDSVSHVGVLDKNMDAEGEIVRSEQVKLSSEEDLESLLKLAENLKDKVEKARNTVFYYKLCRFFILTFSIIFSIGFIFDYYKDLSRGNVFYTDRFIWQIFGLLSFNSILFFLVLNVGENFISKIRENLSIETLALKEVLQLLREVHGTIAEREDWSILKRAEFRIRLSRFDLSEKKESVFSFFS